jgi:hypothetical protein
MTVTMLPAARPALKIPSGVNKSNIWRDSDGVLQEHAYELPVDKATHRINGRLFACPVPTCEVGDWAIEPATKPKMTFCGEHGDAGRLAYVALDPSQEDPVGAGRQHQLARLARLWADKRSRTAEQIRASIDSRVTAARQAAVTQGKTVAREMKGHYPTLGATGAVAVGVIYTVDMTSTLETTAIAAALTVGGLVAGYTAAVVIEKIRLALRKEKLEGRAAKKARERGIWVGSAALSAGAFMAVTGLVESIAGLEPGTAAGTAIKWGILAMVGMGLAWWTSGSHWMELWNERRRLRQLAEENARRAAEAEARRAEREAAAATQEADLREQQVERGALDPDDPVSRGNYLQIEWERIGNLPSAPEGFPRIKRTKIVPEQTREILAPDPQTGEKVRIGWEYVGVCEPGALVTGNGMQPPILAAKEWLVSVLFNGELDSGAVALVDCPDNRKNTFMVMITEKARLGDPVPWRAKTAVRVDHDGVRYGQLGRSLTGDELEEVLYTPGQPFGGMVMGTTGGGKSAHTMRYMLNLLLARILPVLFDPKGLVDYGDFVGIIPVGWTKRHRRIILTSLALERQRREGKLAVAPQVNRYGAEVAGESKWQTHDPQTGEIGVYGEPICSVWDEFHDLVSELEFLVELTNHVRFQRAAAMGALFLSQGGGLADWGNSELRDLINQCSLTQYRSGDMQSRMAGNRNQTYSTADLPVLAGMCLRQAPNAPRVPLRAAFITRDPKAEDTVYTTLWGKTAEKVMQIDDPMTWISDETRELWEETGLMELWRLGREGGVAAVRADTREDEEDDEQAFVDYGKAVARPTQKAVVAAPKMSAQEVLMAILFENPGISRKEIDTHEAWTRAPGWGKPANQSQISRDAKFLDGGGEGLPAGAAPKIDRGPNSSSWRLTPAGYEQGRAAAAKLQPKMDPSAPGTGQAAAVKGVSPVVLAEMMAAQAAEMAEQIAQEQMMARRS